MFLSGAPFLLYTVAVSAASIEGVQYPTRVITRLSARTDVSFICTKIGVDCSTCLTQAFCTTVGSSPVLQRACTEVSSYTPYCNLDKCARTPPESEKDCTAVKTETIYCTSEGNFPHPSDCNKSYYCSAANAVAQLMTCANDMVFNSLDGTCRNRLVQPCVKIDCARKTNAIVTFQPNPAYYALCVGDTASDVLMFKCLDEQSEVYDASIQKCRYNCKVAGNYADRTNCKGYVICAWSAGWVATKQECAPNQVFKNSRCISSSTDCVSEIQLT